MKQKGMISLRLLGALMILIPSIGGVYDKIFYDGFDLLFIANGINLICSGLLLLLYFRNRNKQSVAERLLINIMIFPMLCVLLFFILFKVFPIIIDSDSFQLGALRYSEDTLICIVGYIIIYINKIKNSSTSDDRKD